MQYIELISKILWAFINIKKPNTNIIETIKKTNKCKHGVLFIAIDYDGFANRTLKTVGNISYECGTKSIKNIVEFAKDTNYDYIHIVATDDPIKIKKRPIINERCLIGNKGTDIASLKYIRQIFENYEAVIVGNSSCALADTLNLDLMLDVTLKEKGHPFVAGFNANSRISPRLPFSSSKYPHVITNLFSSRTTEICEILNSENFFKIPTIDKTYENKYFSIRYFEILLSLWVLQKGGDLILIDENKLIYPSEDKNWPDKDTRLKKYS